MFYGRVEELRHIVNKTSVKKAGVPIAYNGDLAYPATAYSWLYPIGILLEDAEIGERVLIQTAGECKLTNPITTNNAAGAVGDPVYLLSSTASGEYSMTGVEANMVGRLTRPLAVNARVFWVDLNLR